MAELNISPAEAELRERIRQAEGPPRPDIVTPEGCKGRDCGRDDCPDCSVARAWYADQDGAP